LQCREKLETSVTIDVSSASQVENHILPFIDPKSIQAIISILQPVGRFLSHRFTRGLKLTDYEVDSGQFLNLHMRNTFGSPIKIEQVVVHLPNKNQPLLYRKEPSMRADEEVIFQISVDVRQPVSVSFHWRPINQITASESRFDKIRDVCRRHFPTHIKFTAKQIAAIANLPLHRTAD